MKDCSKCRYKIAYLKLKAEKVKARAHEIVHTKDGPRYRYVVDRWKMKEETMKKKLRSLVIERNTWRWYLKGQRGDIVIFSPEYVRHQVSLAKFLEVAQEMVGAEEMIDQIAYTITPKDVRTYIEKKLMGL